MNFRIGIFGKPNLYNEYHNLIYSFHGAHLLPHESKKAVIETYFSHRVTRMSRNSNYGLVTVDFIEFYPQEQWFTGTQPVININLLNSCDYLICILNPKMESVYTLKLIAKNLFQVLNRYQNMDHIELITLEPVQFKQPWHEGVLPRVIDIYQDIYYNWLFGYLSKNPNFRLE